ncbi:TPA: hypothetical protein ACGOTF_001950 [Streptococcus suis]|nr:hypothetical protein [Streptococcus infantarius subsp. infantarius]
MDEFEKFKEASYRLIAELITKNSSDSVSESVFIVIDKLLEAKDLQIDTLANEKALAKLTDIEDKLSL